jgi:hypothetical protein
MRVRVYETECRIRKRINSPLHLDVKMSSAPFREAFPRVSLKRTGLRNTRALPLVGVIRVDSDGEPETLETLELFSRLGVSFPPLTLPDCRRYPSTYARRNPHAAFTPQPHGPLAHVVGLVAARGRRERRLRAANTSFGPSSSGPVFSRVVPVPPHRPWDPQPCKGRAHRRPGRWRASALDRQ